MSFDTSTFTKSAHRAGRAALKPKSVLFGGGGLGLSAAAVIWLNATYAGKDWVRQQQLQINQLQKDVAALQARPAFDPNAIFNYLLSGGINNHTNR